MKIQKSLINICKFIMVSLLVISIIIGILYILAGIVISTGTLPVPN